MDMFIQRTGKPLLLACARQETTMDRHISLSQYLLIQMSGNALCHLPAHRCRATHLYHLPAHRCRATHLYRLRIPQCQRTLPYRLPQIYLFRQQSIHPSRSTTGRFLPSACLVTSPAYLRCRGTHLQSHLATIASVGRKSARTSKLGPTAVATPSRLALRIQSQA